MIREYIVNLSIITEFHQKYLEILWNESVAYNFPFGKTQQRTFKLKTQSSLESLHILMSFSLIVFKLDSQVPPLYLTMLLAGCFIQEID